MFEIRQLLLNLSEFFFSIMNKKVRISETSEHYAHKTETTLQKQVKEFNGGINPECS